MRAERARSFLDRTHRFTMAWVYEVPWLRNSRRWLLQNVLGNWVLSGMYTAESPQYATVQSGLDSNRNLDGASDRVVVNPNGVGHTGSDVTELTNSDGQVVGYLADNPNARYVKAGAGVHPNGGRNTLPLRGINNFDVSVSKRVLGRRVQSGRIPGRVLQRAQPPPVHAGIAQQCAGGVL